MRCAVSANLLLSIEAAKGHCSLLNFIVAVCIVHAFVFRRLEYCGSIFVNLPGLRMEKLRRVHWAAARIIGGFAKTDHISKYMRKVLHWLPFSQHISYRIASLVWRYLS